jgi:predicted SAM-dependent methyltransferase
MFAANKKRLLNSQEKLHLACGTNVLPGWVNVDQIDAKDVVKHDLTRPLPLASATITFIFAEHFIEHITREQGLALVRECHRLLKPGGVLRISTPDIKKLIAEYLSGQLDEWRDVQWLPATPCQLLNEGMRQWGHQFVYDEAELITLLREGGFERVQSAAWRQSQHPELSGRECRPYHQEIILEATK